MIRFLLALAALVLAGPAAAQSITGCGTVAIPRTELSKPTELAKDADCFSRAKVIATAAETARRERIATLVAPAARPFEPTPAVAPTLAGLAAVTSGVALEPLLQPSWGDGQLPKPEHPDEGAFRFTCTPSHLAYDDPIIYPNLPGQSHLHDFFGNTRASAGSTYLSLRTTGESTCSNLLNRSAYWIAAMIHPSGKVVRPDVISIYYKRPPQSSRYCKPPHAKACLPLPRGLRYVFGYDMIGGKHDPAGMRWWNCDGPGAVSGHFATIREAAKGCPKGARLGGAIVSPNCWNGRDLDSPDHRRHMAYQVWPPELGQPVCPATHPYLLPFFEAIPWYSNDGTAAEWKLSSDIQHKTEGGVTLHADWFGAWEDAVQDRWTKNCIDGAKSCTGGDLGDGWQLKALAGHIWPSTTQLVDAPERPLARPHDQHAGVITSSQ
jgi:hypothetical protein